MLTVVKICLECLSGFVYGRSNRVVGETVLNDHSDVRHKFLARRVHSIFKLGERRRQVHWLFDDTQIAVVSQFPTRHLLRSHIANRIHRLPEEMAGFLGRLVKHQ